ncbi:phosphatidate cytidylyltransferase [Phaeobacter sp. PT47_59]|uniref:phosphatidate cytidylyltransferase n=1 Tax=Phaeobacter sp. PT47_59 TaxID=3029979 RepID=UPI0023804705|nr:phosphatidate cytidylyltransferase [Phaeobacter sp. PT47_59]MDE4174610.1 phosphatidate cytidylyltransferase [Phaeobacter sp. PT47_59]
MSAGRWSDLLPRLLSAIVMLVVGAVEIWLGGIWFAVLIAAASGGMVWELVRMLRPDEPAQAMQLGVMSAVAVLVATQLPPVWIGPVLVSPVLSGLFQMPAAARVRYGLFSLWVLCAGFAFVWLRNEMGLAWILWVIGVVVVTDIAGYFAGKIIGGPKLWPRVSPKKTWSGSSAGWVAAAVTGGLFAASLGLAPLVAVLLSVAISMASQAGDIAESALKRQVGVKDSSALIPGHGGLLDRFDGMLGAAAAFLIYVTFLG